jgi:6-phosphogluconolactonase
MSEIRRLVAYVGSYGVAPGTVGGGIYVFEVASDGTNLTLLSHAPEPRDAGYLVFVPDSAPDSGTLYSVDERKTDGRGPVEPAASVHAFSVNRRDASLQPLNSRITPGPRPTFLSYSERHHALICANHGDFQHIERVKKADDGGWVVEYAYDDSTIILYDLGSAGQIGEIRDIHVFRGHGRDPNRSPQNNGHAQASPHAHCAVLDPSGSFVLVCDKGTDRIYIFRLGRTLEPVSTYQMEDETGPRHLAFDQVKDLAFVTCEFSSEIASFRFDTQTGRLELLDRKSTVESAFTGRNEPAEVRVHPSSGMVYVNNRGEDTLVWFRSGAAGELSRLGQVSLAKSIHPGLAARSFAFDPAGRFVLVADRPAHLVRSFAVNLDDGSLHPLFEVSVPDPAFIAFAELPNRNSVEDL